MQGLLKLGSSREDRTKKLMLKIDEADVKFALQVENFYVTFSMQVNIYNFQLEARFTHFKKPINICP